MQKVYTYDEKTKVYNGVQDARLDPLESQLQGKEIWLLPANATFKKPTLKEKDGFVIGFDTKADKWVHLPNYKGRKYYDENGINEVREVGNLLEGQTLISEEDAKLIEEGKLVFDDKTKKLIEYVEPVEFKISKKEGEIETLNGQLIRDIRVLYDGNSNETDEAQAKVFMQEKIDKINAIAKEIQELKKQQGVE